MSMNIFVANAMVGAGVSILFYTVLPTSSWAGIVLFVMGFSLILKEYHRKLRMNGLKQYLPMFVSELLERTDLFDFFVLKLRDNAFVSKLSRLLVVKWIDLSRNEVADILEGVWPGFRDLSEDVSLLDLTPRWFKNIYSPRKQISDELERDEFILDEPVHFRSTIAAPESSGRRRSTDLFPLLLWIAEKRIRESMRQGLPVAQRWSLRTLLPMVFLFMLWRKYPRSRHPMTGAGIALFVLYVISITRGLPEGTEKIFRCLNFSWYKRLGERPFNTDQGNGSVKAVLYALVEPFLPQVNVSPRNVYKRLPKSPALSQASTEDPSHRIS